MISAVIFDMDGTLADSIQIHFAIWKQVLAGHGIEIEYQDWRPFIGKIGTVFIGYLNKERGLNLDGEQLKVEKRDIIKQVYDKDVKIFAGVKELLHTLQDEGYKLAIASSEWHDHISKFLELHGLDKYFSVILGLEDIKKHKPEPDVYLTTAKKLGVNPSGCAVFEDSVVGIEAAKRAGMKCIAVETSFSNKELAQADMVIKNMKEKEKIMEFIRKN